MVTLYNVISEDWYIAKKDGSEDFIPDELWPETLRIYKKFDVLVMGRKTYETIQSYPSELIEPFRALNLRKIVVTTNKNLNVTEGYEVMHAPEKALEIGDDTLVSSGPTLNNYLLAQKLVERIILHQVSTTVGEGIPVFSSEYRSLLILESESELKKAKELIYRYG